MSNDYELLYLAKENNEDAIKILLDKYRKVLYKKAREYEHIEKTSTEDLLNIAMLSFYTSIENYQDNTKFSTYLNKCIDNSLSNYIKSQKRNKNKILNESISLEDIEDFSPKELNDIRYNPEIILFNDIEFEELKNKIIEKLTWKEELIFTLKIQNYTPKEIADITDNSIKNIYNTIKRIQTKVVGVMSN